MWKLVVVLLLGASVSVVLAQPIHLEPETSHAM